MPSSPPVIVVDVVADYPAALGDRIRATGYDNDIRAGQIVVVEYDGTNMQMQSTLGNAASGGGSSLTYGAYASLPATCSSGDRYLASDSVYEFACTATNTWSPFYKGQRVYLPTSISFSDLNSPSSGSTTGGSIYWKVPGTGANFRGKIATIPSAPYTLTTLIRENLKPTNYARAGMILYDGT